MSKHSTWWFASGEHKKLSPSANSTLSSTEWGQDIKTTPSKTSTRLYGTKTKWKNSHLAITNNSTIFALIFHILAPPRPLSTRLGAFSYPETFSRKFFPKFFPIRPRRLFSVFLVRKIMGVKGTCRSTNRGGCPFLYALFAYGKGASVLPSHPLRSSIFNLSGQIFGKKGQKWIFIWWSLVFSRENRRQEDAKS